MRICTTIAPSPPLVHYLPCVHTSKQSLSDDVHQDSINCMAAAVETRSQSSAWHNAHETAQMTSVAADSIPVQIFCKLWV